MAIPKIISGLRPGVPATGVRNLQSCSKWLGEGAKGVLAHVGPKPFALVQERDALVQNRVALVQSATGQNSFCTLS